MQVGAQHGVDGLARVAGSGQVVPGTGFAGWSSSGCGAACRCRCRCPPRCGACRCRSPAHARLIFSLPSGVQKCGCIQRMGLQASGVASGRMKREPPVASISTTRVMRTRPTVHCSIAQSPSSALSGLDLSSNGVRWHRVATAWRRLRQRCSGRVPRRQGSLAPLIRPLRQLLREGRIAHRPRLAGAFAAPLAAPSLVRIQATGPRLARHCGARNHPAPRAAPHDLRPADSPRDRG